MSQKYLHSEISALGEYLAFSYFGIIGKEHYPIDPEIIATKIFGLHIYPQRQLISAGVRSGIDTTQSVIFIDYDIYMNDSLQYLARQGIAHELGHVIFDSALLRQLSTTSIDDAFELHEMIVSNNKGIELTAHKLSGCFLVPREAMLRQVARMILKGYDIAIESFPKITLGDVFLQLQSSSLSRYFGVSDDVIRWRFHDEEFHNDFRATLDTPLNYVSRKIITNIAGMKYEPPTMSERIRSLIPEELSAYFRQFSY